MKNKYLNLETIIRILSEEEIIFQAHINACGQDTNYEEIEFVLPLHMYSFSFFLDQSTHGHTIQGGTEQWFYTPKTKEEFLDLIIHGDIPGQ